jgi:hypothetical protein
MGIQVNAQLEDSEYIRNVQRCIQNVQSNSMLPSAVPIIPFYSAFYTVGYQKLLWKGSSRLGILCLTGCTNARQAEENIKRY